MCQFEGWTWWVEPAYLLWKTDDPDYERAPDMTWNEEDEPELTPEEEHAEMTVQVNKSDGFDIDFSKFRCIFNYHLAYLDSDEFVDEPETTGDLLTTLSQNSLSNYNKKYDTEYEFVELIKANFHCSAGVMFLITFKVVDPYDKLIKLFQARVRYAKGLFTEYVFCRPKPDQAVECIGIGSNDIEKYVKKPRLV